MKEYILLVRKIGNFCAKVLLEYFCDYKEVLKYIQKMYNIEINENDLLWLNRQMELIERYNVNVVDYFNSSYPIKLKNIIDAPLILLTIGNLNLLNKNIITIIGTRNPTQETIDLTCKFSKYAKDMNFVIMSGFCNGVDLIAHENSFPNTIGVIAGGFDSYMNKILFNEMMNKSLLITDQFFETKIQKHHFLHRNTLLTSLSSRIIVMQCLIKSGTMDSVQKAEYYNIPLFVVPSHPLKNEFEGNLFLMQRGIKPIISPIQMNEVCVFKEQKKISFELNLINSTFEKNINIDRFVNKNINEIINNSMDYNEDMSEIIHLLLQKKIILKNSNIFNF